MKRFLAVLLTAVLSTQVKHLHKLLNLECRLRIWKHIARTGRALLKRHSIVFNSFIYLFFAEKELLKKTIKSVAYTIIEKMLV